MRSRLLRKDDQGTLGPGREGSAVGVELCGAVDRGGSGEDLRNESAPTEAGAITY